MKKMMAMSTACCMLLLAACGGGTPNGESGSDGNGSSHGSNPSAEPKPGATRTLEFWYIDTGEKEKVYMEAVERFKEKHPGVEVKTLQTPNDTYKQKFAVAMSGGTPPDVFHSWGGSWLKEFVDQDNVLDISSHIDKEHYVELALNNATFDDKVYGVPLGLGVAVFYYNKELFGQHGLTPPETYDDLLEIVDTLTDNKVIPIALANQPKWPGAYYLMYFADRIAGPDLFKNAYHRSGRLFDDAGYVKAGEYIQELVKKDAFNKGFNGIPYDAGQGRQLLYTEQAAMMLMSNGLINNVRDEAPEFEAKLDTFLFPALPDGMGSPSNLSGSTNPVWSVSAKSEHPDLAIELAKELSNLQTAQDYADRTGTITAVQAVNYKDPFSEKISEYVANAEDIHMPYDQTLPPELAELHKDTTQALFGLSITPEEAAARMEEKAKELLE